MTDVPVRTTKATQGSPGLPGYEPGYPGVGIGRTMIDVPGSELHEYWVRDAEHASQVWRDHYGTDYPDTAG
jgi:hypothetical protein